MKPSGPGATIRRRPPRRRPQPKSAQHPAHGRAGSRASSASATPGFLEVQDVEEVVAERSAGTSRRGTARRTRDRRHAQSGHRGRTRSGCSSGNVRGHDRAPVVPDDRRLLGADVVEQARDVGGQCDDVVVLDRPPAATSRRSRADRGPARGSRHRPGPGSGAARSRPARGSRGPAPPPVPRDHRPRSPSIARRWYRLTVRSGVITISAKHSRRAVPRASRAGVREVGASPRHRRELSVVGLAVA